jgi:nicotinamidase/pyrazinamidase
MKQNFLIVDPQKDFCDKTGSLYVPNAEKDIEILSNFLSKNKDDFYKIFITKDAHHKESIFHPAWFLDSNGNNPAPFTNLVISKRYGPYDRILEYNLNSNSEPKEYFVSKSSNKEWTYFYLKSLKENDIVHTIWPEHCIINTKGQNIADSLNTALNLDNEIRRTYTSNRIKYTDYIKYNIINKGSNKRVESFSPFKSEIIDPDDDSTTLRTDILDDILECDKLFIAGEALSHCVKKAILDIKSYLKDDLSKIVFCKNCSSIIPGYEKQSLDFLEEIESCNAKIIEI